MSEGELKWAVTPLDVWSNGVPERRVSTGVPVSKSKVATVPGGIVGVGAGVGGAGVGVERGVGMVGGGEVMAVPDGVGVEAEGVGTGEFVLIGFVPEGIGVLVNGVPGIVLEGEAVVVGEDVERGDVFDGEGDGLGDWLEKRPNAVALIATATAIATMIITILVIDTIFTSFFRFLNFPFLDSFWFILQTFEFEYVEGARSSLFYFYPKKGEEMGWEV
jgi:hypothetical protein